MIDRLKGFTCGLYLSLALTVSACGGNSTSSPEFIKFSSDLDEESQLSILDALASLEDYPIQDPSQRLLKMMKLDDASPDTLRSWMAERVRYVVPSHFNWDAAIFELEAYYEYENPNSLPDPPEEEEVEPQPEDGGGEVITLMSNMGAALYVFGKRNQVLLGVNIPGHGEVAVTSPRVGLLQAGDVLEMGGINTERIFTLSTLFHEGRHSDGSHETVGFGHSICPSGHDLEGYFGCDENANGPYSIDAELLKNLASACPQCSLREKEILRLLYMDAKNRVLVDDSVIWDDKPEGI